jgi:hypothetical protein
MSFHCDVALADSVAHELPRLARVLGGYFHQDAYIFTSDEGEERIGSAEDIFDEVCELHELQDRQQCAREVEVLVSKDDSAVVSFWNRHCDCHSYNLEDAAEARRFLLSFRDRIIADA